VGEGVSKARRRRRPLLASVIVAVVGMLMASPAAWAVLVAAANWQMNETSGQMRDSSGKLNHGTPTDVLRTGSTYRFNGSTSRVAVPDTNNSLDPLGKDITLRARVKVTNEPMDDDSYDVVRKGFSGTPGGDYKMEVFRTSNPAVGRLHCVFKGTGGTVKNLAPPDIVDGGWHTLECKKTSNSVVARVDGQPYTATGTAGSISNAKEVLVGAKKTNPFDDMFEGEMDFVSIVIAQ
jgi:Concanavalin A-like lectin/glucanases superfamily